ncbi:5-formyltetrahydrofolate cyclo-ligase [Hasllibacter sp. MH4015]|uniref:5-formyltetrahydrofolate cyclo-ligase n=1 Tax=Hasllibacter sp. MH4015 TaxID=2854029 RepID=UPI001CD66EC6|nr:5-formyltetrahydrofolate cyclo-ligase [Hasllibacter sp. MH4015]
MKDDDPKAIARRSAFAARKAAHACAIDKIGMATSHLLDVIGPVSDSLTVSGYLPIRTEIDPRPAMTLLHAQGARLCVPVIRGPGERLDFREWTPHCALVDGPFGAEVPADGAWLEPDIVIAPLVAFDTHFNRLGYGGGFYDRTLHDLRDRGHVRAIGFAYAAQQMAELPQEPTDQPLDQIVTENGPLAAPAKAT